MIPQDHAGMMKYDLQCHPVLQGDGRPLLDELEARLLRELQHCGSITAAAKRLGADRSDLIDLVLSLNARTQMVDLNDDEVELTPAGVEVLQLFELRNRVLQEQLHNLWHKPWVAVDAVILMDGKLVLVRRGKEPAKGRWALPGGFLEYGESTEEGVVREVQEETGLNTLSMRLVNVYSDPERDPRGQVISIVYLMKVVSEDIAPGDDASEVEAFPLDRLPPLAFDHASIIKDALALLSSTK